MTNGLAVFLVILAVIAMISLPKILASLLGNAVGKGVDKAVEAHKRSKPTLFWLVPGDSSPSSLRDTVRTHVTGSVDTSVNAEVILRKGRDVVECSIAPGEDVDSIRADILRAARKADASCVLELP